MDRPAACNLEFCGAGFFLFMDSILLDKKRSEHGCLRDHHRRHGQQRHFLCPHR